MTRFVVSIVLGLLVSSALRFAFNRFAFIPVDAPWTTLYEGISFLGEALLFVIPGFVAGWCAARRGLVVGAVIAVLLATGRLLYQLLWRVPLLPNEAAIVFGFSCVAGVLTQSIGGAAGEFLRSRWAPLTTHSSGRSFAN